MRRFSLKRLFASLTLAGIGLAIIGSLATREYNLPPSLVDVAYALFWISGGMILGAGLLLPFNRPVLGMILGFAMQFLLLAIAFLVVYCN
jgi:hypothetical protein